MCAVVCADYSRHVLHRHVSEQWAYGFIRDKAIKGHWADDYVVYVYGYGWYTGSEWLREFE